MADARIRLSLSSGELELEGSEAFIEKYEATLQALLQKLKGAAVSPTTPGTGGGGGQGRAGRTADVGELAFGEALHRLPKSATGTDQILVAGKFAGKNAPDGSFTTAEANALLVGQGIKLSNASQAMRGNLTAKRVFKVGGNRWKLSRQGEEHATSLLPAM